MSEVLLCEIVLAKQGHATWAKGLKLQVSWSIVTPVYSAGFSHAVMHKQGTSSRVQPNDQNEIHHLEVNVVCAVKTVTLEPIKTQTSL